MRFLSEDKVYEMLDAAGLPVLKHKVFHSYDKIDWDLFPAVVKPLFEKPVHKTEMNAVFECLDKKELLKTISVITKRFPDIDNFVVEEKLHGIEVFLTLKRDSSFGFVAGFGTGGFWVEFLKDVVFVPNSATKSQIIQALHKTKLFKLLTGYRNVKGNIELFVDFVLKFLKIPEKYPELMEVEINPLFVSENFVLPADGKGFTGDILFRNRKKTSYIDPGLFFPERIAVIGASKKRDSVGYAVLKNLSSFTGKIFPVNPKYDEIHGKRCFPSISSIPGKVDCAVIAIPACLVPEVLKECGEKGVKLAVIISAGFGERGGRRKDT